MKFIRKYEKEISAIKEFKETYGEFQILNSKRNLNANEVSRKDELREKIKLLSGEVQNYVRGTGISASIYYSPPPSVGGMAGNVGLFENLFILRQFQIPSTAISDMLDKAIGNYMFLQKQYKKKIWNPLYWIGKAIRLPFSIFSFAGFNVNKIESSIFGKLYKLLAGLILLIAAIVTILSYCDINFGELRGFISN
jgi:hypothetical protein